MEKRIKSYLKFLENIDIEGLESKEAEILKKECLIQIGFFAHERQIHLFVTLTFALLTVIAMAATVIAGGIGMIILSLLLLALLIPYIRHYYILENSVQKMYRYYDRIAEASLHNSAPVFSENEAGKVSKKADISPGSESRK